MKHYVYIYALDSVPRYVGKGVGSRWKAHRKGRSTLSRALRAAFKSTGEWICPHIIPCESDNEAIALEIKLIKEHGRLDLGLGTLWNLTDGGDGAAGLKHSDDFKAKMKLRTGKNNPFFGLTHTSEVRQRLSEVHKGNKYSLGLKRSESHRRKISDKVRGDLNPACKIKKDQYHVLFELRAQGLTQKQIGERVGLSQGQVSKILLGKVK